MSQHAFTQILLTMLAASAGAQSPARLELVRCVARGDAPCFRLDALPGGYRPVFTIPQDAVIGLARNPRRGLVPVRLSADSTMQVAVSWRPPLIALPQFRGTVDSAGLSPAVREAVLVGNAGGSDRPVIVLLLVGILALAWMLVARIGWGDVELAAAGEPGAETRIGSAGPSAGEAPPRGPEDVTRHTARRTALRR